MPGWLWTIIILLLVVLLVWFLTRSRAGTAAPPSGQAPDARAGSSTSTRGESAPATDSGPAAADDDALPASAESTAYPAAGAGEPVARADVSSSGAAPAEDTMAGESTSPNGAGSALPGEDGSGPEGWAIKGNADSMLFHTEESPAFEHTHTDVWFKDEEAAAAAGFQRWDHHRGA